MKTSLQGMLSHSVRHFPAETAIQTENTRVSYAELNLLVQKFAFGLRNEGIGPGDHVAWFLPNCLEAIVATLACYQVGSVAVPLNYRYVFEEALDVVQRVGAKMLLFHADKTSMVRPLFDRCPQISAIPIGSNGESVGDAIRPFDSLLGQGVLQSPTDVETTHPAFVLFTSGSTGHPKGVVHSHAGAFAGIEISRQMFDFTHEDVVLVGKPISHAGGLQTQLMPSLLAGAKVVLAMKPTPSQAVALINTNAVTEYGMLASDLLDFVEYLEENDCPLPTLTNSIGSGDSVPPDLHERFKKLTGWEVMEGAGMTEVGGYYAANPRYGIRKWGSLGLPTPATEIRIVSTKGRDSPSGETGEIMVRSPSATIGYLDDEQATKELFRNGWLRTGDLGHLDDDGYVWFVGRRKLMIVRRGSNIAPSEVESIIDSHPTVHASVVVGLPDPRDGQVPVACVSLNCEQDDSSELSIRNYVAEHLAAYKNPVHYLFFNQLPRTSVGKFDRHRLQEEAASTLGSENRSH